MIRILSYGLLVVSLFGCATNQPIPLRSVVGTRNLITTGPSLSMADQSLLRWATAGYGRAKDIVDMNSPGSVSVDDQVFVGGGLLLQPDLTLDWHLGPFLGIAGAGAYSKVTVSPNADSRTLLEAASVTYDQSLASYSMELSVKPGFVSKFPFGLVALHGLGYLGAEFGPYAEFREKNNGVGNLYNMDVKPLSFGWGLGVDLQLGVPQTVAGGLTVDVLRTYNRTQTYVRSTIAESSGDYFFGGYSYAVDEESNGIETRDLVFAFQPYLEYKNVRFSSSVTLLGLNYVQVTYRW